MVGKNKLLINQLTKEKETCEMKNQLYQKEISSLNNAVHDLRQELNAKDREFESLS